MNDCRSFHLFTLGAEPQASAFTPRKGTRPLLLFSQRRHRLGVGILRCLPRALHLLVVWAPRAPIGTDLGDVQPNVLQHHREFIGSAPAIGVLLRCRHHLSLQPTDFPPLVERDNAFAKLRCDLRNALPVQRSYPPSHTSFDSLARMGDCAALLSPLEKKVSGWRDFNFASRGR